MCQPYQIRLKSCTSVCCVEYKTTKSGVKSCQTDDPCHFELPEIVSVNCISLRSNETIENSFPAAQPPLLERHRPVSALPPDIRARSLGRAPRDQSRPVEALIQSAPRRHHPVASSPNHPERPAEGCRAIPWGLPRGRRRAPPYSRARVCCPATRISASVPARRA